MKLDILTVESAQSKINHIDEYYIGVKVEFSPSARTEDTLVRVFADNDNEDVGGMSLITEFYMTGNDHKYISLP